MKLEEWEGAGNYRTVSARKITDGPRKGSDAHTAVVQHKGES